MRPGKPLMAGDASARRVFLGLPGNPVSAYVTATLFLLPLVRSIARDQPRRSRGLKMRARGACRGDARRSGGSRRLSARLCGGMAGIVSVTSVRTAPRRGRHGHGRLPDCPPCRFIDRRRRRHRHHPASDGLIDHRIEPGPDAPLPVRCCSLDSPPSVSYVFLIRSMEDRRHADAQAARIDPLHPGPA
jgi:hypothetical protein